MDPALVPLTRLTAVGYARPLRSFRALFPLAACRLFTFLPSFHQCPAVIRIFRSQSVGFFVFVSAAMGLGLSAHARTQDLGAIFGNFGEIKSANLVTDNNGDSKGYGFVKVRRRSR